MQGHWQRLPATILARGPVGPKFGSSSIICCMRACNDEDITLEFNKAEQAGNFETVDWSFLTTKIIHSNSTKLSEQVTLKWSIGVS